MVDIETLDVMSEIEAFVTDKLQVVSYKWLSRKFSVSSNEAKRLLKEFAETHGNGLEVIYTLSGWLKDNNSTSYHIKLVSAPKLSDVRKEFEDNCSVQVYSVQACIPKDPAALWNAEFVQSEELFNQPANVDNCLWDNRYCGVSNSFVKRNTSGSSVGITPQQAKTSAATMSSRSNAAAQPPTAPEPLHTKVQQVTPKSEQTPAVVAADINNGKNDMGVNAQAGKPDINKEKDTAVPANKKKVQGEKSSSVSGGSIANLWGRAKAKPACATLDNNEVVPNTIATGANLVNEGKAAHIDARDAPDSVSSDDDDGQNVKYKRTSNGESSRKRRVVFDLSDEEDDFENAVNLASPDPPKQNSNPDSKENSKALVLEKKSLNFEEQKGDQLKIKQEKETESESSLLQKASVDASKRNICGISILKKTEGPPSVDRVDEKAKANDATSSSPKRRKVVKTRIDERGREVNEVVWEGEGEEPETKKNDKASVTANADNRPPPAKKSPSLGSNVPSNPVTKAGAKKTGKGGGVKDAKQGNILSFFKRA